MSIFALATAPGISGLAVLRVSGKEALKIAKTITKFKKIKARIANFSTFYDSKNRIIDKGIFIFSSLIDGVREIFDIKNTTYANIRKNVLVNLNQNALIKKNLTDLANKGLFI